MAARPDSGGRGIRVDTYQGQPDITFFRLATSDAAVASHGAFVREQIEQELWAAGFNQPGKISAVYYDGGSTWSVAARLPRAQAPTSRSSICKAPRRARQRARPTSSAIPPPRTSSSGALLHEIVHAIGFVPPARQRHPRRPRLRQPLRSDWAGDQPWGTDQPAQMQLDVGHDDYYQANIPGCLDLSQSPYLDSGGASLTVTIGAAAPEPAVGSPATTTQSTAPTAAVPPDAPSPAPHVTLRATPDAQSVFSGWTGACTGASPTCDITLDAAKTVQAVFSTKPQRLRVTVSGHGRVTSTPAGSTAPRAAPPAFQQHTSNPASSPSARLTLHRLDRRLERSPHLPAPPRYPGRVAHATFRRT